MKSLQKMAELADRLEQKVSRADMVGGTADTASAVVDSFFDPPSTGKDQDAFQNAILREGSKFNDALPAAVKSCVIGAMVDAKNKMAKFLVTTSPNVPPAVKDQIILALNTDYVQFYGKTPSERIATKSAAGLIRPADLNASNPSIITIGAAKKV